jgi:phage shock protein A
MGIFSRMKKGIKAKANAAIDKAIDPERELEIAIMELEEQRKSAIDELISYKATAKQMEQDMSRVKEKSEAWEKKARTAVKAGDDDLARKALAEKKYWLTEREKIRRDRDEAAGYAIELNRSRKKVETKLKILKLKKGTMATQIAAARSGGASPFGHDDAVWDKFQRAEEKIDEEAIQAEVDAALKGEEADGSPIGWEDVDTASASKPAATEADFALAELKAKMAVDKEKKKLPK